jgi:hypothetical protein
MVQIVQEIHMMIPAIINGIDELNIQKYFTLINQGDFESAASLFEVRGYLDPPFDQIIQGREAIAKYLEKEAKGMQFCPESGQKLEDCGDYTQFEIQGSVKTSLFTVSIEWLMQLNSEKEIIAVEVKLLDSLNDLLNLKNGL